MSTTLLIYLVRLTLPCSEQIIEPIHIYPDACAIRFVWRSQTFTVAWESGMLNVHSYRDGFLHGDDIAFIFQNFLRYVLRHPPKLITTGFPGLDETPTSPPAPPTEPRSQRIP